ncbi:MAG: IS200/IS605 family transposase [Planctomycetota bacterium]|nr:IS200/IS605 family transposase [Planctomycetota bacterium]
MAQSLARILLHVVFSTKNREDLISDGIRDKLHAYLAGACRGQGSEAFRVGGTQNHVHIACSLPRTVAVSELLEEIKKTSSGWMKKQPAGCKRFSWQAGYGAFSLGQSQLDALIRYIENQSEHHRARSFKEEFLELLHRYGVPYDERYVWD